MSRGRPTVGLEDLQDLLQSAYGAGRLEQAVAQVQGRKPLVNVTAEVVLAPNMAGGSMGMAKPTDHPYRMTRGEFRREVRRMVKVRRREWAEVVDMVLSDHEPPEGFYVRESVVAGIQIAAAECARELRASMAPERPPKAPKVAKMPVRTRGESSSVVVHTPGGGYADRNGVALDPFEAATVLSTFDPYAKPAWDADRA